jgi:dual specificity protein kinase YAK1
VIALASVYLNESYKRCNPAFGFSSAFNPRRQLTKPATATANDGHDNENSDLIISVNDVLAADDGRQGLTLVHGRAQLEQLQDTLMS